MLPEVTVNEFFKWGVIKKKKKKKKDWLNC